MIPCELVATKLLPVIRKQIVIEMLKDGKKQREIARALDLNESAVSHYLAKRRASAKDGFLDRLVREQIKELKPRLDKKSFALGVCEICKNLRISRKLCIVHKRTKSSKVISPEDCKICMSKCV